MLEESWHVKLDQLGYLEVLQMKLRHTLSKELLVRISHEKLKYEYLPVRIASSCLF